MSRIRVSVAFVHCLTSAMRGHSVFPLCHVQQPPNSCLDSDSNFLFKRITRRKSVPTHLFHSIAEIMCLVRTRQSTQYIGDRLIDFLIELNEKFP